VMRGCRDLWARMSLCCHASRQALNEPYYRRCCLLGSRAATASVSLISAIGLPSLVLEVGTAQATAILARLGASVAAGVA
jgi:hypothetical protein